MALITFEGQVVSFAGTDVEFGDQTGVFKAYDGNGNRIPDADALIENFAPANWVLKSTLD